MNNTKLQLLQNKKTAERIKAKILSRTVYRYNPDTSLLSDKIDMASKGFQFKLDKEILEPEKTSDDISWAIVSDINQAAQILTLVDDTHNINEWLFILNEWIMKWNVSKHEVRYLKVYLPPSH